MDRKDAQAGADGNEPVITAAGWHDETKFWIVQTIMRGHQRADAQPGQNQVGRESITLSGRQMSILVPHNGLKSDIAPRRKFQNRKWRPIQSAPSPHDHRTSIPCYWYWPLPRGRDHTSHGQIMVWQPTCFAAGRMGDRCYCDLTNIIYFPE
jgi:hypothetical protein